MTKNILIVDDEDHVKRVLVRILAKAGYQCVEADNALQARQCLEDRNFDLILCDIIMPGESGIDFIQYVSVKYPDIAVIMVTGIDDTQKADDALKVGVYGYIIKPFSEAQVLINVQNALRQQQLKIENQHHLKNLEKRIQERTSELEVSEKKFRSISDSAQDAIIMMNPEGKIEFWNKASEKIFGYSSREALGQNLHRLIVPEHFHMTHEKAFQTFKSTGQGKAVGKTLELSAITKDEKEIPVELSLSALKIREKWHAVGILRDITYRKRAEKELKEAHVKATQLLASISSIIVALDMEDNIVEWNQCAEKSFGLPRTEVIGKKLSECSIDWDIKKVSREINLCKTSWQRGSLDDVRLTHQNKKERLLGISFNPVLGLSGKIRGVLIHASDITDRRHLESQLAQAQKLESIGQLAAGIAHEINTPTQYVGDNTRFLKEAFEDMNRALKNYGQLFNAVKKNAVSDHLIQEVEKVVHETDIAYLMEEVPTAIEQTLEGLARVTKIVRSMKEFSHPGVDEKTTVDINDALENTITVARNEWKYVADVKTDFEVNLPLVACLPGELNQVFLNIIINAAHAISDASEDGSEKKGIITASTRSNGNSVKIRISDTGRGIPEDIQPRIFDPFFTTKEVGRGTGQGLAISHTVIVEKHGGSISYETELGKGTTFIIQLPIQNEGG